MKYISVIIPVYSEEFHLSRLLPYLRNYLKPEDEIIVVDAQSNDDSKKIVTSLGEIFIPSEEKCRAAQMNLGARHSSGQILYFLHADTIPPTTFRNDIVTATEEGYALGSYPFKFDMDKWYLRINEFCTRFNYLFFRGGDQSIYITKDLFEAMGGYDSYYCVMEDFEFLKRARKISKFKIMKGHIIVSARKYKLNSYFKVNLANLKAVWMFNRGVHPGIIRKSYAQLLTQDRERY